MWDSLPTLPDVALMVAGTETWMEINNAPVYHLIATTQSCSASCWRPCAQLWKRAKARKTLALQEDLQKSALEVSNSGLIDIHRHKLRAKVKTNGDLVTMIEGRHRRRFKAMQFAHENQSESLGRLN